MPVEYVSRFVFFVCFFSLSLFVCLSDGVLHYTGWPKKVSHHQFFKKIVLKIANEIRFLRKVEV